MIAAASEQLAAPAGSTSREHQPGQCSMPTSVVLPEQAEREREAFLAQRAAEALQQAAAAEQARLAEEAAAAARMEELARVRRVRSFPLVSLAICHVEIAERGRSCMPEHA